MQTVYANYRSGIVTQPRLLSATQGRTAPALEDDAQSKSVAQKPYTDTASQFGVSLVETLICSTVYREYVHAFSEATGLTVALLPMESWQLPLRGKRHESPFCALMSEKSRVCACCVQMQKRLAQGAVDEPLTMACSAGSSETAVPVRLGSRLIGLLQTGQVFGHKPTSSEFDCTFNQLAKLGMKVDLDQLKDAYFATRVMPQKQQDAATRSLRIFAERLSRLSNQVIVQQQDAEPPMIAKAKAYMQEHQTENVHLEQVAQAVNTNKFYLCKLFKRVTGINFTDYVSRIRIERARNLLINPNLRMKEIAFEAGFQSITNFNRLFKRLLGQSPTNFRRHLMPGIFLRR